MGPAMAKAIDAAGHAFRIAEVDAVAPGRAPGHWRMGRNDVADEPEMRDLFGQVAADWGGLDTLRANAGFAGPTARVEDIALSDWRSCLAVRLDSVFLTVRYAAPLMKPAGRGAIVLTSSTAGHRADRDPQPAP
ncbi:SDR family oxidoreductase [Sedimentitalea sp. JM2-8]|uniref:SDR family oxidoreductase n=1 Tax=Sedimentitalea xiamensis TaxID=3050037 RepID=A0ABT7FFM1_9RHOB|nr:SDR family oxidoreductase [Sedimentitalea xiamensis]MDK3073873.1 SDR family oxidoreductase [Sedimentitalea xiamensis]